MFTASPAVLFFVFSSQIKTQFEALLPEAGLHFAQMLNDLEAHARSPVESLQNCHCLLDGAIKMRAAAAVAYCGLKKTQQKSRWEGGIL